LDPASVVVITGGIPETTSLLKEKFDHIFFTGGSGVGKIVAEAASKHLTPCTLELGGKCPLYMDDSIDMKIAVKRLIWGKMINLGQTCVAPDYVLCSSKVESICIKLFFLKNYIKKKEIQKN
jgi:acyl-CoA reductase-like NAD-dependent aldehyde dehydrogenase